MKRIYITNRHILIHINHYHFYEQMKIYIPLAVIAGSGRRKKKKIKQ